MSEGLGRMFHVAKTDRPDAGSGFIWSDCEVAWINERITLSILAEREQCAMVADEFKATGLITVVDAIANEIRMRSNDLGNRRDAGPYGGASELTDELEGNGA